MKNFFKHSRKGSALLIGLIITTLLSLLVIGFLDKVLRVGKNTKAIEQSTQAYYLATGIIEDRLRANATLKKEPWNTAWQSYNMNSYSGQKLEVHSTSSVIPQAWKGNSPFGNTDYNLISLDKPVQIVIPNWMDWNNVGFEFRIPKIDGKSTTYTSSQSGVILWTIGDANNALFAVNSADISQNGLFLVEDINQNNKRIWDKKWYYYDSSNASQVERGFKDFYDNQLGTRCANYKCTLKLSMLQSVKAKIWRAPETDIPFLEYKINFTTSIPEQFMTLDATGKVANYQRKREVLIPQITTNTALDFAVLQ